MSGLPCERWQQIIRAAYSDPDLCGVLAQFLEAQQAKLVTRSIEDDGRRYKIVLDRPHIAEVERGERKHWQVMER